MTTEAPVLLRLLAQSVEISKVAGSIIRKVLQGGDLGVVDKGKDDPQTEADRSAQRSIMASLLKVFPNLTVIGEEGESDLNVPEEWLVTNECPEVLAKGCHTDFCAIKEQDIVVWVDPLDGTQEFTQGNLDRVTVLIGIAVNGKAIGGVINQPFYEGSNGLGRIIWGLKGIGVHGIEIKKSPENKFVITTTRSHADPTVLDAINVLKPDEILRVGGAGYKVIQLLDGSANAYVFASPGCKKWDTCAPEAILEVGGGKLTDIFGNKYNYNKNAEHRNKVGVIAAAPDFDHSNLLKQIPCEVKSKLL